MRQPLGTCGVVQGAQHHGFKLLVFHGGQAVLDHVGVALGQHLLDGVDIASVHGHRQLTDAADLVEAVAVPQHHDVLVQHAPVRV